MNKGDIGHSSALYVWNGFSVFWGMSFNTSPHHHNTLQLVFDIDRSFRLKDKDNDWQEYSAAIIKDGHIHQLDSNNSIQLFLYLDRESIYAKQLTEKYLVDRGINDFTNSDIRKLSNDFFKKLLVESNCDSLFHGYLMILKHLINLDIPALKDDRVEKAIAFIAQRHIRQMTVKDVAMHVCLSESRLRHLFKKQVGQPLQNFILWMKIVDSLNLIVKGNKVEETAYAVGFWDASHMNRSYKTLLGVTPGAIQQLDGVVKIIACNAKNHYSIKTTILKSWNPGDPGSIVTV